MGKPVVSADVGDVPLYVKNHINGYVENLNGVATFADRILSLKDDKIKLKDFGEQSRMIAISELDISIISKRQINAYRGILLSNDSE